MNPELIQAAQDVLVAGKRARTALKTYEEAVRRQDGLMRQTKWKATLLGPERVAELILSAADMEEIPANHS